MLNRDSNPQSTLPCRIDYSLLTTRHSLLVAYFQSGWAFLIPYLAAYLLYAWLKWPVNPVGGGQWTMRPCLLDVYWFLHAVHLVLGTIALRTWWRSAREEQVTGNRLLSTVYQLMPWLCLALLFSIPGIYLEWPSDPWEHLRRINEWHMLDVVTAHTAWKKSSYFLAYSLTGQMTGLNQLSWLNYYYTAVCLLLSWQYYRLARAVGLGMRASFIFVLLNVFTFGNNIFSFYRYYGLSSSILAQIGAVVLTRIAIEALRPREGQGAVSKPHDTEHVAISILSKVPAQSQSKGYSLPPTRYSLMQFAVAVVSSLTLIALNHPQGLVIAGLGIGTAVAWRLTVWRRNAAIWLVLTAVIASVATLIWFPRHPALDGAGGWLTVWHGYKILDPSSPAFERSYQILGIMGVLNIVAGFWLLRRNHVAGWLTVMAPAALMLPCFAMPLTHALILQGGLNNILVFHRMLLAIPMGLALITAVEIVVARRQKDSGKQNACPASASPAPQATPAVLFLGVIVALAALVALEPLSHHRFWHSLQVSPADMQLQSLVRISTVMPSIDVPRSTDDALTIDLPLASDAREAFQPSKQAFVSLQSPVKIADLEIGQRLDWLAAMMPSTAWLPADPLSNAAPEFVRVLLTSPHSLPLPRIISRPTGDPTPWLVFAGASPLRVLSHGQFSLTNPAGSRTEVFSPDLIPIFPDRRYRLSIVLWQSDNAITTNYLAVAWFDRNGKLLQSAVPSPDGAGMPLGWSNGTYSYFGRTGQPAELQKSRYETWFGLGENAAIPQNAVFIRIGALLNYRSVPQTTVGLSDVTLEELPIPLRLRNEVPDYRQLVTPASLSARLSGHWSPQHVAAAQAGATDLHVALSHITKRR